MGGIKNRKKNNKVSDPKAALVEKTVCEQYPAISYRYMTTNKKYRLGKNSEHKQFAIELHDQLNLITCTEWTELHSRPRGTGTETIPFSELNFQPNGYSLSKDEKLTVFRFCQGKKRIIGFRKGSCPTFYVIGLDLDYSAYNHGS